MINSWSKIVPGNFCSFSHNNFKIIFSNATSPFIFTCKKISVSFCPLPIHLSGFWGSLYLIKPTSGKGLIVMIFPPLFFVFPSAVNILGWFVPGFCPITITNSAWLKSSRVTEPFPIPRVSVRATPLDSWHIFEQSGKLFVPYFLTNNWYKNAASLLVLPEV